jgi:TolB protein
LTRTAFFLPLLALLGLAVPAAAQPADEVWLGSDTGVERIPLDVAPLLGDSAAGLLIRQVVNADLLLSGLFQPPAPGDRDAYKLEGVIEKTGERFVVTASLRQGEGGVVLFGKRWSGSERSLRRIAHRISDAILEVFTGRRGPFDSRIAYVSQRGGRSDVWVMDYDGAHPQQVTQDGELVLSPEVSDDGTALLFTSYVGGEPGVYRVDRVSGDVRRLLAREGLNQSPAISPDGGELAISAAFDGNSEIYVTDLAGGSLRRLTRHPGIDVSPDWSPTGTEIVFQSDRPGTPQVHAMSSDGLGVRRLTFEGSYNGEPAYSPDGSRLAFSSRKNGKFQIAVMELSTGRVEILTHGPWNHESPSWSPDGEFLAYACDKTGRYDVWIMRRDGTAPRALGGRGTNRHPFWYR